MELKSASLLITISIVTLFGFSTFPHVKSDPTTSLVQHVHQRLDTGSVNHHGFKKLMQNTLFRDTFIPSYIQAICNVESFDVLFSNVTNTACVGNVKTFLHQICNIDNQRMELWAMHMIDAWAKPPEGILSGHINPMGDYDECVSIVADNILNNTWGGGSNFKGRYCTVYLNMTMVPSNPNAKESVTPEELLELMTILQGIFVIPSIGTCFPDTCTLPDIAIILRNLLSLLSPPGVEIRPLMDQCYLKKKPDFDAGDIAVMALIGTLAFLSIFSGIVDVCLHRGVEKPKKQSLPMQYLMAFSLYTNTKKWLSTNSSGDDLGCLHGIRCISTTWVILAHTWYMVTFIPVWNMVDLKKVHEDWAILTILNSTISVDTFFVLSGLLVAFNVLKVLDKQKGRLNIPMFYIHRYLRITPAYAILIAMMATIVPYLGGGPFWKIMERWSNICENNWWTNLLYVNNFVNTSWLCQGEAWYLANDMQFYILSPLVLYPLWGWPTIGIIIMIVCTILSILTPGFLVYFLETTPTSIGTRDIQVWFLDIYIKPWGRVQTYLVGIWMGYILYRYKGRRVVIPRIVQLVCWVLAAGSSLSVLYGMYPYFDPLREIPRAEGFVYAALNRFVWGCSVCWVIFACCKGYGGLINSFLSWKVFIPLGRLCFCVFLVSLHLQMILHLSFRQAITFEPYSMVNFFFAHLVMSFLVGYFCTMFFESPFMKIEKLIFEGGDRGPRPKPEAAAGATPPKERYGIFYNNTETIINGIEPSKSQ